MPGRQVKIVDEEINSDLVSQTAPSSALQEGKELEILDGLEPDQRQAIEMRVISELPYGEIAAKLGRSEVGVRQMVSRGLRKLRNASSGRGGI